MKQRTKSILIIAGALFGLVACSLVWSQISPANQYHFALRMLWALGMVQVGIIGCVGGYEALDTLTDGDWGAALLKGNMAVAVTTGCLFLAIGLLLLGVVSVVM